MPTPRPCVAELTASWQRAREPVFWLDRDLRLAWVNSAWEQLTGMPAASVVGLTCLAHAPTRAGDPADLAAGFHPPPEALAGVPVATPGLILRPDGERLYRRIEFWPFSDEQGELIGLLGAVRPEGATPTVADSQEGRLHAELLEMRRRLFERHGMDALIGSGPAHRRLIEQVRLAAGSCSPVLLVGERGTGKRHVARTIHQQSDDRRRPFVSFDCEALPAEVLERELFGGDRELPGGGERRPRLSLGEGSTLLIDEVLSLPRDLQLRLVQALDTRVRLMATTAREPEESVRDEQLRPELYYALTTIVIRLFPLRRRRDEIPALAQHLLERANERGGAQSVGFTPRAIEALTSYDWPGNLSELARVVDHAHTSAAGRSIDADDLPASIRGSLGAAYAPAPPRLLAKPLDELLTEVERRLIEAALKQSRSNKSRAAEILGISRPRLYRRIKELSLPDDEDASEDNGAPAE